VTNNQLFFALAGLIVTLATLMKYYIDAKIDPVASDVKLLVQYMVSHEGRISRLEERTERTK
jgi:hypothetical protein